MDTTTSSQKFTTVHEKLNNQLPYLSLTAADIEKYPDFCSLLSNISSQVNRDGLSHQTHKDLTQAEEVLRREKHGWLLNHILYTELQELLLDYELKSQEISLSSRDQQFYSILQQCLTQAEVGNYLDFSPDPSSKATALGLTWEELERQNPHKKHMQALQQVLIPEVEERLRRKCENLVVAHDPQNSSSESTKLMFAKSSQLPAMVETDLQHLKEEQAKLKEDNWRREKQFTLYYQKLVESLRLLEKLLSKYKLQKQTEHDTILTEWMFANCDAMCLKIKLIEIQTLCDTYTVDTIQSLKIIRKHLDDAVKESENEKLHREQALKAYTSLGEDFTSIVSDFGRMKEELENKQWALKEFDQSQQK